MSGGKYVLMLIEISSITIVDFVLQIMDPLIVKQLG
jgi:hypothetical protein